MKNVIDKTAEKFGVTSDEVLSEINKAIAAAMNSDDPSVRRFWENFGGCRPSAEELIGYISFMLPHRTASLSEQNGKN